MTFARSKALLLMVWLSGLFLPFAKASEWSIETITAADGVPIVTAESGNTDGTPVLLLHGLSGSLADWHLQLNSPQLVKAARIIAMDLRGHGASGKPWADDDYEVRDFAADVNSVIAAKSLCRPVLVGWSFGGRVITSYVRHFGVEALGGVVFVAGPVSFDPKVQDNAIRPSNLGNENPPRSNRAQMFSDDMRHAMTWANTTTGSYVADPLDAESQSIVLASHLATPSYVRRAIFANLGPVDDIANQFKLPVAFIHGKEDPIIPLSRSQSNANALGSDLVIEYPRVGHSPPLEAPSQFNEDVAEFLKSLLPSGCH